MMPTASATSISVHFGENDDDNILDGKEIFRRDQGNDRHEDDDGDDKMRGRPRMKEVRSDWLETLQEGSAWYCTFLHSSKRSIGVSSVKRILTASATLPSPSSSNSILCSGGPDCMEQATSTANDQVFMKTSAVQTEGTLHAISLGEKRSRVKRDDDDNDDIVGSREAGDVSLPLIPSKQLSVQPFFPSPPPLPPRLPDLSLMTLTPPLSARQRCMDFMRSFIASHSDNPVIKQYFHVQRQAALSTHGDSTKERAGKRCTLYEKEKKNVYEGNGSTMTSGTDAAAEGRIRRAMRDDSIAITDMEEYVRHLCMRHSVHFHQHPCHPSHSSQPPTLLNEDAPCHDHRNNAKSEEEWIIYSPYTFSSISSSFNSPLPPISPSTSSTASPSWIAPLYLTLIQRWCLLSHPSLSSIQGNRRKGELEIWIPAVYGDSGILQKEERALLKALQNAWNQHHDCCHCVCVTLAEPTTLFSSSSRSALNCLVKLQEVITSIKYPDKPFPSLFHPPHDPSHDWLKEFTLHLIIEEALSNICTSSKNI